MKRLISALLTAALLLLCIPTVFAAEQSVYSSNGQDYDLQYGTCKFWGRVTDIESWTDYYYSDGFFAADPAVFDPHLATLSITLANTAYGRSSYSEALLKDCGFTIEYVNSHFEHGTSERNSVGFLFASKELAYADGTKTGKTLYVVLPRGTLYGSEWCSNVTIGTSGDSQGISQGASSIVSELKTRLSSEKLKNGDYCFWIAGYSRGGSLTNMVARQMIDDGDFHIDSSSGNQLYAYGAGVSALSLTGSHSGDYSVIHNIVNDCDLVCSVIPPSLGFTRLGTDWVLNREAAQMIKNSAIFQSELDRLGFSYSTDFTPAYLKLDLSALEGWNDHWVPLVGKADDLLRFTSNKNNQPLMDMLEGGDISFASLIAPATDVNVSVADYLKDMGRYLVSWKIKDRNTYAATPYSVTLDNVTCSATIEQAATDMLYLYENLSKTKSSLLANCIGTLTTALGLDSFDLSAVSTVDDLLTQLVYIINWEKASDRNYIPNKSEKASVIKYFWNKLNKCTYTDESGTVWTLQNILGNEYYSMFRQDFPAAADLLFSLISHDYHKDYSGDAYKRSGKSAILISTMLNAFYQALDENGDLVLSQISVIAPHGTELYISALRAEDSLFHPRGDVDNDGEITAADIVELSRYIGAQDFPYTADINADGAVDSTDLRLLSRYVAHISDSLLA